MVVQYRVAVGIDLALKHRSEPRALQAQVKPTDTCEKRGDSEALIGTGLVRHVRSPTVAASTGSCSSYGSVPAPPVWTGPCLQTSVDHRHPGDPGRPPCRFAWMDNGVMSASEGSWASSPAVRATMIANRSRDTGPELSVRRLLHAAGFRYRVNLRPVVGIRRTVDIAFTRARVAVLIDGCFWHGCEQHYVRPHTHQEYWDRKIQRNRERDRETDHILAKSGWTVVRLWEHVEPELAATIIIDTVRACRGAPPIARVAVKRHHTVAVVPMEERTSR